MNMTTKIEGAHPWLVILCCPSDRTIPAQPDIANFAAFIAEAGTEGIHDYWWQISRQKLDLRGSRVLGWYTLTQTLAQIDAMSRSAAAALARTAAADAGVDITGYRYTLAVFVDSGHFGAQGEDVACGVRAIQGQPGWRWCKKCEGLAFWDGSRQPGTCAAGGRHDHSES